jgi:chlorophyll synthase
MAVPQMIVVALLLVWGLPVAAGIVAVLVGLQGLAMRKWLTDPRGLAPWYNGAGVTLFVAGMMTCSVALAP